MSSGRSKDGDFPTLVPRLEAIYYEKLRIMMRTQHTHHNEDMINSRGAINILIRHKGRDKIFINLTGRDEILINHY